MTVEHPFNKIVEGIAVSDIRQFDAEVSTIPGIIKLTLGEPNFDTPEHIKEAAIQAIKDNHSHYTPNSGIPELRQAAAEYYNKKFNFNYTADQVITTIGATEGINASLQAILNPGDTVIVPTPVFPLYLPITLVNQGNFITVDTSEDGFVLTADKLRETIEANPDKNFKAVVLVYPSNPTGVTYSKEQLEDLAEVIKEHQLWALCDEVYAELTYDKTHYSLANILPEQTIVITGLSKSHAMTGWRIGFILGPTHFMNEVVKTHQYMVTAPTSFAQYGALAAMLHGQDDCAKMMVEYSERRDYLAAELKKLGFEVASPDGAFYLFAKIPAKCGTDSWAFVRDLAPKAKVALIPGVSFGPGGESYVRFSYAASMENLKEVVARLTTYFANIYIFGRRKRPYMVFFCFIVYILYRLYLKNVELEHVITIFGNFMFFFMSQSLIRHSN